VTEAAYGTRPAPAAVRVTRLLGRLEQAGATPDLGPWLAATFAEAQARWAAGGAPEAARGPNGAPQVPVEALKAGARAAGPALIVLPGATAYVPAGMPYQVDEWGSLVLETRA
jgi:hypothetical protein